MSTVLELMEKRKKAWETAKAFLDSRRGSDGLISAEDNATYERMEADVVALGKEIERLQRQAAIDAELTKATSEPIKDKADSSCNCIERSLVGYRHLLLVICNNLDSYILDFYTFINS